MVNETNITPRKFSRSTLFFILNYIACLIVGIIVISVCLILVKSLTGSSTVIYLLISLPILFLVSLIAYLSVGYFDLSKKKILITTITLSLLISMASFGAYYLFQYLSNIILSEISSIFELGGLGTIDGITGIFYFHSTNPIILSILIIVFYNLFPFINLIKKDNPSL